MSSTFIFLVSNPSSRRFYACQSQRTPQVVVQTLQKHINGAQCVETTQARVYKAKAVVSLPIPSPSPKPLPPIMSLLKEGWMGRWGQGAGTVEQMGLEAPWGGGG